MKTIKPLTVPIVISGRLIYDERARAHAIIRLKRRILEEFSQLKTGDWRYQLEYHRDYAKTIERIKEAQQKEQGIPFLVFICPGGSE